MAFIRTLKLVDAQPEQHDPTADELEIASLKINSAGTGIDMNGKTVSNLSAGVSGTDGVNVQQLNDAVITGGSLKELLLHQNQVDDASGLYAAAAFFMSANPTSGDTLILYDGTTLRTYGFGAGGDVTVTIGGSAAITMQNLATAITGDGPGAWDAVFEATTLAEINGGGVVVIYENTTAVGDSTSRMYGTWVAQANANVLEFAAGGSVDVEYRNNTPVTLPGADPTEGRFGVRRTQAELSDGEIHDNRSDNFLYKWDDTANVWFSMTGPGSIPDATSASGGGIKGKVTLDSDKGLEAVAGVAAAKVDGVGTQFDGSGQIARKDWDTTQYTAGAGGVTLGDPVYPDTNDTALPCVGNNANAKKCIGAAAETVLATNPFRVQQEGVIYGPTIAKTGALAVGDTVWLDNPTGLTADTPVGAGLYALKMGIVKNTTGPDLHLQIQYMGKL